MTAKQGFWTFKENEVISFLWKGSKMKVLLVLLFRVVLFCGSYGSLKTAYPGKFQFLSHYQICSLPIRFEYSLIFHISGMDLRLTWMFCIEIAINKTNKRRELVWSNSEI